MIPCLLTLAKLGAFFRIKQWLHVLGLVLLGHVYAHPYIIHFKTLFFCGIVGFFYLAHGYSLNDIFDHQLKTPYSRNKAFLCSLVALFLSLCGSALISFEALIFVVLGHLSGMLYSASPFRFKNKLILDLIFNACSFVPLFLIGVASERSLGPQSFYFSFLIFLYFLPVQLMHEMQDSQIDRAANQKNTFQILRIPGTLRLLYVLLFIFVILSFIFWAKDIIQTGVFLCNALFALSLSIYIFSSRIPKKTFDKKFTGNLKIITRYISICYGIMLTCTLYFNI
jgi:4-hydroxybenzoate polyprenyltransferase